MIQLRGLAVRNKDDFSKNNNNNNNNNNKDKSYPKCGSFVHLTLPQKNLDYPLELRQYNGCW